MQDTHDASSSNSDTCYNETYFNDESIIIVLTLTLLISYLLIKGNEIPFLTVFYSSLNYIKAGMMT